jgi:hypothetical protein
VCTLESHQNFSAVSLKDFASVALVRRSDQIKLGYPSSGPLLIQSAAAAAATPLHVTAG